MLLFDGIDDYLEHMAGAICTSYPYTMIVLVAHTFENSGAEQVVICQGSTTADAFHTGGFVDATEIKYATDRSAANGTVRADKSTAPDLSATVPQWLIVHFASASDRRVAFGSSTFVTETTAMTSSIGTLNRCLVGAARRSAGLLQFGEGSFGEAWWINGLPSTAQLDELIAGTRLPENLTGVVDGVYLNVFEASGNYLSHTGTRTFVASGGVSASSITHPISRGPAAPVLSSPAGTVTSNTAATVTHTTDTPSTGTTHYLRRTGGSQAGSAAIIATGESQSTTAGGQSRSVTLLGGTANQFIDIVQSGPSNVITVGPLSTATTLSSPTGAATGTTTATAGFTTDRAVSAAFPAYFLTLPAATAAPADAAALIANGATVSQTTGGTTPTRGIVGLTAATAYRTHMAQPGSNVVSSGSYTTSASGTAPTITVQPSNQTVTAGATATFSVTATGTGLTYQWRRNGTNISGATSSSYSLATVLADNGAVFSVVVTGDTAPAATSSNATLTVNAAPAGLTLTAVATDATGSTDYLSAPTRLIIEPLGNIENWGTGSRTISATVTALNGEVTLPVLAPGRYSVLQIFPATGATVTGVALDIVTVP